MRERARERSSARPKQQKASLSHICTPWNTPRMSGILARGSPVFLFRDDGTDATLLRQRPTNSRSADAFVVPKVVISAADRLLFLDLVEAEGVAFALVRTASGVQGFVNSKYLVPAHAGPGKHGATGYSEVGAKGKGSSAKYAGQAAGSGGHASASVGVPAQADDLVPFRFDVLWEERWSATGGITYYNTKTRTSHTQRPDCFPLFGPFHQHGPVALRSKSIIHPFFVQKPPSPSPIPAAAVFLDPEQPTPALVSPPSSAPPQSFADFFACLQKYRAQLGGARCADAVPVIRRYTGMLSSRAGTDMRMLTHTAWKLTTIVC